MHLKDWIFTFLILVWINALRKCTAEPFTLSLTGKTTWQSSDKDDNRTSEKAVDGCKEAEGSESEGCCTHTEDDGSDPTPWWSVDLQHTYILHSVTLLNRKDWKYWGRLSSFVIYGSNTTHEPESGGNKVVCAKRRRAVGNGVTETLTCADHIQVRYIIIHRTGEVLTLCEVEVAVECQGNNYGVNCSHSCPDHCRGSTCKDLTGECDNGCDKGYQGNKCDKECDDGFYGSRCHHKCSSNCREPTCQKASEHGTCPGGCKAGFEGHNCTKECVDGFYGVNCMSKCSTNCLKPPCSKYSDTGDCTGGCQLGFQGHNCTEAVVETSEQVLSTCATSNCCAIVQGLVVLLAIVAAIFAGLLILYFRKRTNTSHANSFENIGFSVDGNEDADTAQLAPIATSSVKPVLATKPPREKARHSAVGHDAVVSTSATRLGVNRIGQYIYEMRQKGNYFRAEYEDIPKTTSPWEYADMPKLRGKNRYTNIMPYDCNRVKLTVQDNEPLSDYINASGIMDYGGKEAYIAAQGPTEDTLNETWKMIWEYRITNIFMMTNLREGEKSKCEQYWPSNRLANYGDIRVKSWKVCSENHIEIRSFKVTKENESRTITQYHYTGWSDHRVPSSQSSILRLRELLKEQRLKGQAPILVHCSAGVGRTGTLIALDILMDQMEAEAAVDVCQCVTRLRHQRTQMVQTLVQYRFLYDILHEYGSVGETSLPVRDFKAFMQSDFKAAATKQFQFLEEAKPVFTAEELEFGRIDNRQKNQDLGVISASNDRIKFSLQPEAYVNAVYVQGFNQHRFCATQIPLGHTIGDFWKVVFQEKCVAVVCLETDSAGTKWFPAKSDGMILDGISVSTEDILMERDLHVLNITVMEYEESEYANVAVVKDSEVHCLKVFVLQKWTDSGVSVRDKSIIKKVYDRVQKLGKTNDEKPILVMCRNGATESGLYIAATVLLDMVQNTGSVDFVQVVKQIRKNRPQFITSQDQFEWLHGFILGCT